MITFFIISLQSQNTNAQITSVVSGFRHHTYEQRAKSQMPTNAKGGKTLYYYPYRHMSQTFSEKTVHLC